MASASIVKFFPGWEFLPGSHNERTSCAGGGMAQESLFCVRVNQFQGSLSYGIVAVAVFDGVLSLPEESTEVT